MMPYYDHQVNAHLLVGLVTAHVLPVPRALGTGQVSVRLNYQRLNIAALTAITRTS